MNTTTHTFNLGGDLTISRLGFGAMRITGKGVWGMPNNPDEAKKVLKRALELGVNFIDTSDAYGPHTSEQLIHDALYPYSDGLVIATKGGLQRPGPGEWIPDGRPEHLKQALEGSLQRLELESIDLYQLHRIDAKVPMEETVSFLKSQQDAGKIKHFGLSEVSVEEIEAVRKIIEVVRVQNLYNLSDRKHQDVLDYCEKNNIAFIPWFPLATGSLAKSDGPLAELSKKYNATPAQLSLAWLLQKSPVIIPIPGTSSVNHLEENMGALEISLTEDDMTELEEIARIS